MYKGMWSSGALEGYRDNNYPSYYGEKPSDNDNSLRLNAHNSNAVYTDNGLILPKSISKQSYIIYK